MPHPLKEVGEQQQQQQCEPKQSDSKSEGDFSACHDKSDENISLAQLISDNDNDLPIAKLLKQGTATNQTNFAS